MIAKVPAEEKVKLCPIAPGVIPQAVKEELTDDNIVRFLNSIIHSSLKGDESPIQYCRDTYYLVYHEEYGYYTLPDGKLKLFFRQGEFVGE